MFAVVRVVSLGSYAVLAVTGHYGVTTILACESVTMAAVVILWSVALRRGDPRARSMVIAFVVSAAAGVTRAVPEDVDPCGRTRPGLALPPRPDAGDGDALPRSAPSCRDGLDEDASNRRIAGDSAAAPAEREPSP